MKISRFLIPLFFLLLPAACVPLPQMAAPTATVNPDIVQSLVADRLSVTPIPPTATQTYSPSPIPSKTISLDDLVKATLTAIQRTFEGSYTPTASKTPTITPSVTKSATITKTPRPSNTPTIAGPTETPAPQDASFRIFAPASFSRLVSPIKLVMAAIPGSNGNVHVTIVGERGETIYENKWIFPNADGKRTTISEEIPFTLETLSESARITVFTYDEYDRIIALQTADVVLIGVGSNDMNEPDNMLDPFALLRPYPDQLVKKGELIVNGMTRCRVDCKLYVEAVDSTGKVLGEYAWPDVIQAAMDYQNIYTEIPIKVKRNTQVRVILHQREVDGTEDIAISSMLVTLLP